MTINYERLTKTCTEARAYINKVGVTTDPEQAYQALKDLEHLARKEAWNIKYDQPALPA